jgi:hypothetical protein
VRAFLVFASFARITMPGGTGQSHLESFTEESPAPDERVHGWISKESPRNSIEFAVYKTRHEQGDTKMVNHHVQFQQEIWGTCQGL